MTEGKSPRDLPPSTGTRVLVVEDGWQVANSLKFLLDQMGMMRTVGPIATPEDARRVAIQCPLELAIVDVNLKGVLGEGSSRPLLVLNQARSAALYPSFSSIRRIFMPAQTSPYQTTGSPPDLKEKVTDQFERIADKATDTFRGVADQAEHLAGRVADQGREVGQKSPGSNRQPEGRRRQVHQGTADGYPCVGRCAAALHPRRDLEVVAPPPPAGEKAPTTLQAFAKPCPPPTISRHLCPTCDASRALLPGHR